MASVYEALAYLSLFALPYAAYALGRRLGSLLRAMVVSLASLVSLPMSFLLMLLASDPAILTYDRINPGIGVVAAPAVVLWFAVFSSLMIVTFCVGLYKIFAKYRPTNPTAPS